MSRLMITATVTDDTVLAENSRRRLVFAPLGIDGVSLARVPQDLDGTACGPAGSASAEHVA
jgi:hypothetical protein